MPSRGIVGGPGSELLLSAVAEAGEEGADEERQNQTHENNGSDSSDDDDNFDLDEDDLVAY